MAIHDLDLAYTWADEACLISGGRICGAFPVDQFPNQAGVLELHGLGMPQVAQLHPLLAAKGILSQGTPAPRSYAELVATLRQLPDR